MSKIWFTSDWHLGHNSVEEWRKRETGNNINHQELAFECLEKLISKRDVVYFLGDMLLCRDEPTWQLWSTRLKSLNCKKVLIAGNHETDRLAGNRTLASLVEVFDEIHGMLRYKKAWLTHAPLHPSELRGRINLHGHTHFKSINDNRYINTCLEANDFMPLNWQVDILPRLNILEQTLCLS